HPDDLLAVFEDLGFELAGLFVASNGAQGYFDIDVFAETAGAIVAAAGFAVLGEDVLIITQMEKGPQVFASAEDDMAAAPAVAAAGPAHGFELGAHKVFAPAPAVPASCKDPDLVYKV